LFALDRRLGDPQNRSGHCREIELQFLGHPACGPLLYQLNYTTSPYVLGGFMKTYDAYYNKNLFSFLFIGNTD
jgi:hypothetical protein